MSSSPQTVLVTGGAGFIGSHLVDLLLARGYHVVALDNLKTGRRADVNPAAQFVEGDVTRAADLAPVFAAGVDVVCHIAGQASIRLSYSDPTTDLSVNTIGTLNVIQQCIEHRVPRLLFASSMTIYGNPQVVPTPETAPPDPVSYYGITKYAAERYVHLAALRRDLGFTLNATSFRMFNVYGVRQSLSNAYQGVFAIFLGNLLRGEPITIHSDGEQARDFVHVSDVVRAWADAIDRPATYQQVINLGTGTPQSINRLCDLVLRSFDLARERYDVRRQPAQPGDIRMSAADITKAKRLLGWQPEVPFEDGMRETIQWAREQIR